MPTDERRSDIHAGPAAVIASRDLIASLTSTLCPMCGGVKKRRQTMCLADYRRLSRRTQMALYDGVGDGYMEAVAQAMNELQVKVFRLPAPHGEIRQDGKVEPAERES